jgi:hypothetical protein
MRTRFAPSICRPTILRHLAGPALREHCHHRVPTTATAKSRSYSQTIASARPNRYVVEFLLPNRALRHRTPVAAGAQLAAVGRRGYASVGAAGFMRKLLGRKGGGKPKRDETMSSRYLDASPEDAILGRSLRQKSANDDYLRCTEFDREGVLQMLNTKKLCSFVGRR